MGKREFFTAKYAAIQGFYWSSYCVFYSFAAVFLEDKGFSSSKIGLILALANILAVVMQPVVAAIVDQSEKITIQKAILALMGCMIGVSILMCVTSSFVWIVPVLFVIIYMCLQTVQPLNSSLGMECEYFQNKFNFGLARGLGSCAYAVTSILLGIYLLHFKVSTIPYVYCILFLMEMISVKVFIYQDKREMSENDIEELNNSEEQAHTNFIEFARYYPKFMLFLLGVMLVFFTHTLINNFAINMIENVGGNSTDMGIALGVAAFCELPAMALFAAIRKKTGVRKLLVFSYIMFTVKHVLFLLTKNIILMIVFHSLQMFAFAVFLPAGIYYVNALMNKKDAVKGQAFVTIAITVSGIFSSVIGGYLIDLYGFTMALTVGTILSFIGSLILIFGTENVR